MLSRHRHAIGRIGNLRHETFVLAQSQGDSLTRSRGPKIDHVPQKGLVGGDRIGRWCFPGHGEAPACAPLAMAALTGPTAAGAIETTRIPASSRTCRSCGSEAISPHTLTSTLRLRPASTTDSISLHDAGMIGLAPRGADRRIVAARTGGRVLHQVVGADRIEIDLEAVLRRQGGGRYLHHHAKRRPTERQTVTGQLRRHGTIQQRPNLVHDLLGRTCHHRHHDLEIVRAAAARSRARSCTLKRSGDAHRERRRPRTPRKGLVSPSWVMPGIGLSPPASRVRMVTGRLVGPVRCICRR